MPTKQLTFHGYEPRQGSDGKLNETDLVARNSPNGETRADALFQRHFVTAARLTDHGFAILLLLEWLAGILIALVISPRVWAGIDSQVHLHIWAAVLLGGLIISAPLALAYFRPGWSGTRYSIAISQMLMSALLIHLTGGRIETHFHIFGSLAFLAFYRDWKVFVPATTVVVLDHVVRGILYPTSIYGVLNAPLWRIGEHAWWVAFEVLFLGFACVYANSEMRVMARNSARLELTYENVALRTKEVESSEQRLLTTVATLSSVMEQVQLAGIQVTGASTSIGATSKQQQATLSQQATASAEIMATSRQISATANELVSTVSAVAESTEETAALALEGNQSLVNMQTRMGKMVEASTNIVSKLTVLNEKASNINSVITTITKVADQTNLLSLNAAIEAEKAGEYGRGFGVVATEIRRLADQTAMATLDIERMVTDMQSAVAAGVMGMDKFRDDVRQSDEAVHQVVEQLGEIVQRVQEMSQSFIEVDDGMKSQAEGASQISDSIRQLAETVQQNSRTQRDFGEVVLQLQEATEKLQTAVTSHKERNEAAQVRDESIN